MERADAGRSRVRFMLHTAFNPVMQLMFRLLGKKKMAGMMEQTMEGLKRLSEAPG